MMRQILLTLAILLTTSGASAAEPYCMAQEVCEAASDACQPDDSRLVLKVQPTGKVMVLFREEQPMEATPRMTGDEVQMTFTAPDTSLHEVGVSPDGSFTYQIKTPNGENKSLYRGECVEG